MSDYYEDEWYEEDQEPLYEGDDTVFCFRCGYPLEHGECANVYCSENPNYCADDGSATGENGGPAS